MTENALEEADIPNKLDPVTRSAPMRPWPDRPKSMPDRRSAPRIGAQRAGRTRRRGAVGAGRTAIILSIRRKHARPTRRTWVDARPHRNHSKHPMPDHPGRMPDCRGSVPNRPGSIDGRECMRNNSKQSRGKNQSKVGACVTVWHWPRTRPEEADRSSAGARSCHTGRAHAAKA